jgi:V8-like Glu-specific endopeptidase
MKPFQLVRLTLFSAIAILTSVAANAIPLPSARFTSLPSSFTSDYNFEGIVALSNCSGALVRFETSKDSDHAVVLTNGHCLESGFPEPGSYVYGKPSTRLLNLMDANGETAGQLRANRIVYSTMTDTDVTIYSVTDSYATILSKYGVHALTLSSKHPEIQQNMEVISGYWHRGYSCQIESFIPQLKEEEWTWKDSIRYSRPGCEVIGGTSGSPIVLKETRTVIGINNTGNEDGESCTRNNPCEIDASGGITYHQGYSYGEETHQIYSCLNAYNEIDLSIAGCLLPH